MMGVTIGDPVVIDLDDPGTWPDQFRSVVEEVTFDADEEGLFDPSQEETALSALSGCRLRAYHCTRLTEREAGNVLSQGLQLLSPSLVRRRLADAVTDGHLTAE